MMFAKFNSSRQTPDVYKRPPTQISDVTWRSAQKTLSRILSTLSNHPNVLMLRFTTRACLLCAINIYLLNSYIRIFK
ncbi:hypothetical protein Y032_0223g2668 [Ancylostoma ceylanicum]|uniref:Uncharacterized protein n=1 Tax=Ancylostoma ceylanicum TaxID=53326 RepID=A0A016SIJ8_9BILA|nr:hypothetical protein Y032_0223g2668 [Ancylostoma ceylanicum]